MPNEPTTFLANSSVILPKKLSVVEMIYFNFWSKLIVPPSTDVIAVASRNFGQKIKKKTRHSKAQNHSSFLPRHPDRLGMQTGTHEGPSLRTLLYPERTLIQSLSPAVGKKKVLVDETGTFVANLLRT